MTGSAVSCSPQQPSARERNRFAALYFGMRLGGFLLGLVTAVAAGAVAVESLSGQAADAPIGKQTFDAVRVASGATLAAIGNCASCHTERGGKTFAGGLALNTPFGVIYSTNITPDAETGIGAWTEDDFRRAMHEGVDRDGRNLYPAFPYDHFTRVSDDDVASIYAFIMTREPVHALVPANRLVFPMNFRPLLSAWKTMFLHAGTYRPDPTRSAEWNRGRYLVDGLGHCGACHTPRNALGAEEESHYLGGGDAEGWHASALNASSPAPETWTIDQLTRYLREGSDQDHGTATGPMSPIVHNLAEVPDQDVRAIAAYLATVMTDATTAGRRMSAAEGDETALRNGAAIFRDTCASCHEESATSNPSIRTVPLARTSSIHESDPRNVLHIVLDGIRPESGEKGPLMPGFEGALTDEQLVSLLAYMRVHFATRPPWSEIPKQARAIVQAKSGKER
ncbi:MAG TPA: cytochrome c [Casimicrobiaceae bacterium]|jgi:mono/diheme cytochrome c family protein